MSKAIVEAMSRAARGTPLVVVGGLAAVLLLGGCTSKAGRADPSPASPSRIRLDASVTQFRFDEGTRNLKAGIVNEGTGPVRISSASIEWDGFAFPTVPITGVDADVQPKQAAAFTIVYGAPRCDHEPAADPTMVAVVDGRSRRLPLRVEDPGLLVRLHDKACARARLDAVATVRLVLARRTARVAGEEVLPAQVVVQREPGATGTVQVRELGGSVLFELLPRAGQDALPAELGASAPRLVVPVIARSAGRCDGHARSQSSQTFLWSVFVRLDDGPQQRIVTVPDEAEQTRLLAMLDRACR